MHSEGRSSGGGGSGDAGGNGSISNGSGSDSREHAPKAKRKRRTRAEAQAANEEEENGYADWARLDVYRALGRRALVDGNDRTCGQDALVTIATRLGVGTSTAKVRAATLPVKGDTAVGAIKLYAEETLGIQMLSLKDHSVLGYSLFEQLGGPEHNLLLLESGQFYVELLLTMPAAKGVKAKTDRHVVAYDADFRDGHVFGLLKDNAGPTKRLDGSDRLWAGKPAPPPARDAFASLFPGAARVSVDNAWLCRCVA